MMIELLFVLLWLLILFWPIPAAVRFPRRRTVAIVFAVGVVVCVGFVAVSARIVDEYYEKHPDELPDLYLMVAGALVGGVLLTLFWVAEATIVVLLGRHKRGGKPSSEQEGANGLPSAGESSRAPRGPAAVPSGSG
jgi:hypothetical protein